MLLIKYYDFKSQISDEIGNCGYVVYLQVLLINTSLMFLHMRLICSIVEDSSMLHGNGSGYVEAEAYGSAETRFLKKLGSGNVLETYIYKYIYIYIYILKYKNLFKKLE